MYRRLRATHLLLGAFGFAFLMMYGVSAVQMAHFNVPVRRSEATIPLPPGLEDARAVARELMARGAVRGLLREIDAGEEILRLRVERLGTVHSITYFRHRGQALVRTDDGGLLGALNRIHHTAGLRHQSRLLNAWGVFVAIVSAALVLLSATGIYLWFKLKPLRRSGALLLAAGLAYGLTLIALIRSA